MTKRLSVKSDEVMVGVAPLCSSENAIPQTTASTEALTKMVKRTA